MANYEVIKYFMDLQDNSFLYRVGDVFPRRGKVVSEERIAELASSNNKQGAPLIKAIGAKQEFVAPEVKVVTPDKAVESAENVETPKDTEVVTTENAESAETSETTSEPTSKKYEKADLEDMKLPDIRELAKSLGFKLSSTSKESAIAEFLEKQA